MNKQPCTRKSLAAYICFVDSMMRNRKYFIGLLPGLLVLAGNLYGGWLTLANAAFILVFLGIAEWFLGEDHDNAHSLASDELPELLLSLHAALHALCLVTFFYGIHAGMIEGPWIWTAALSLGIHGGSSAIVIAHELIHKKENSKQWMGRLLLASTGNFYFHVHHLRIHHRWVGTKRDAATARKGESVYRFFVRSVVQQIRQAAESEDKRLKGRFFSIENEMIRPVLIHIVLLVLAYVSGGITALLAYGFACFMSCFLLEYVNYIEHYGLKRAEDEKVTPMHSWSTDKTVSRYLLIDLSRHADHHAFPSRPYHTLRSYSDAPTLPGGYAGLVIPALIPPLWYALVHPKINEIVQAP
jgi:alkane 1-monooxygenase